MVFTRSDFDIKVLKSRQLKFTGETNPFYLHVEKTSHAIMSIWRKFLIGQDFSSTISQRKPEFENQLKNIHQDSLVHFKNYISSEDKREINNLVVLLWWNVNADDRQFKNVSLMDTAFQTFSLYMKFFGESKPLVSVKKSIPNPRVGEIVFRVDNHDICCRIDEVKGLLDYFSI